MPGSKSISFSSIERGLWAEAIVITHFKKYKLLQQRLRTPFAEVDLIFAKSVSTLLVVEVKTLTSFDFLPNRIKFKQKQRLFRACEYLRGKTCLDIELNWAFVTENGEVLVIDDISG